MTADTTQAVDYAPLHCALELVSRIKSLSADVARYVLDTPCPVPGKAVMRLGEMTTDDHEAVVGYLKTHKGRYPGEHPGGTR